MILCWNCRGLGDPATVHELRDLARECAPAILCVVETVQIAKNRVEGLAGTLGFEGAYAVESSGRSGGVGIFWKKPYTLELRNFSKYHIDLEVKEEGKYPWRLTCWYGEANRSLRYKTWEMMRFLNADCDLPWLCIRDFNEVLRREEQFGPNQRDMAQINLFREAVDVCQLCDLGYKGLDWTFERRIQNGEFCRVRLDRALASSAWCNLFPIASVRHLTAVKSDHSPILLMNQMEANNQRIANSKPFRYELMWERHEQFLSMLEQIWGQKIAHTAGDFRDKLHDIAASILGWSTSTFGAVRSEFRVLRKKLEELRSNPLRAGPSHEKIKVEEKKNH